MLDLSPEEARASLLASGLGDTYAEGVLAGTAYVRKGRNAVVTEDVPQVLRRRARTHRDWAEDHREAFAGA